MTPKGADLCDQLRALSSRPAIERHLVAGYYSVGSTKLKWEEILTTKHSPLTLYIYMYTPPSIFTQMAMVAA
jgi:hypothetical protein